MRTICLLIGIWLIPQFIIAQPTIQWQKTLGGSYFDEATCIRQTTDGGYIIGGWTGSNNGDVVGFNGIFDFWVIKLNAIGNIEWTKALGGGNDDRALAIRQSNDGGYIVVGFTLSDDGDITNFHGDRDAWVVKLSNAGEIIWQKALGGSGWDEAWCVELTADGGFIIGGRSSSTDGDATGNPGNFLDFWVVKLNSSGDIEWQKSFGGSSEETVIAIRQTSDGGYILAGETLSQDGDVQGNNGNYDFWVLKLRSTGDLEWQHPLGGAGLDVGTGIYETADGYVGIGYAGSNNGDITEHKGLLDYWVVKLKKTGELTWQKTIGGTNADYARSFVIESDGSFILAGTTKSKDGDVPYHNGIQVMWVVKMSPTGQIIWQKTLGGTQGEACYSIQKTTDNGYILAGSAWSNDGDVTGVKGKSDVWIVKLAPESVGVEEALEEATTALEIFPNPAHQSVTLKIPNGATSIDFVISDLQGKEMRRQSIPNGGSVDISAFASGLYQVLALTPAGKVYSAMLKKD